jgi:glycosyltransferase involved in cell wall biosynthesis
MILAVVLTKNEEKNLTRCLESLKWCDEVIVIDDQSTDSSVRIAQKYGARVIERPLAGDFAAQRNFALSQARNKWVLFVDADEEVPPKLADEIQSAVQKVEFKGFRVRRTDYLWGATLTHGDIGRFNYIRLGRRGAGEWKRQVDEVWEIEGRVGQLKNRLNHYPHQTLTEFLEEINFKSTINARQFYQEGKRTTLLEWGKPAATFLRSWIIKRGFLDGMPGFVVAILMSFHSFLVRSKLYLLTKSGSLQKW